jgi:hypothetical protein
LYSKVKAVRLRFSRLDVTMALRMLVRYPGLTLVGTVAIAIAIALGTIYFEAVNKYQNPRLPIRDGHRLVSVLTWDANAVALEERSLHDFALWREQVKTLDHLGAAVVFVRNLATDDGRVEPARGAEVTASVFRLMGPPLLGRPLTERDEQPAEPPAVVLSHTLWKTRFGSDPEVVGRVVKLGTASAIVAGVMPEGFGLPMGQRLWMPLRVDGSRLAPRPGPTALIFGRLTPGASLGDAQVEMAAIGARLAAGSPETHKSLRLRVTTFGKPLAEGGPALIIRNVLYVANGVFLMLLAIVCTNVATLVFARTATRGWEIAVQNALGASRGRIVTQLFIEALVLAAVAAVVGLVVAKISLGWGGEPAGRK